jgi:DNA-binding GntR family transcriptional regulator
MAQRVADHVRGLVASGALEPGARIAEATLARDLGVSRSPVREALSRLVTEGVLRTAAYRGTFVAPLEAARFRDLVDFRVALEDFALRRFAAGASPADVAMLRAAIEALRRAAKGKDLDAIVAADLAIHETIVRLAHNAPLERAYGGLLGEFRMYIRLTSREYTEMRELAEEHDRVLDALAAGRLEVAAEILRAHITRGFDAALNTVKES